DEHSHPYRAAQPAVEAALVRLFFERGMPRDLQTGQQCLHSGAYAAIEFVASCDRNKRSDRRGDLQRIRGIES
ncbi:MAG: hypothetical protein ACREXY_18720, partial [Gammaproteobacteria bacterium]